jgi:hypothetical protein
LIKRLKIEYLQIIIKMILTVSLQGNLATLLEEWDNNLDKLKIYFEERIQTILKDSEINITGNITGHNTGNIRFDIEINDNKKFCKVFNTLSTRYRISGYVSTIYTDYSRLQNCEVSHINDSDSD